MSNVIKFPIFTRAGSAVSATRINAQIIPFPCKREDDDTYRTCAGALRRAIQELERAHAAGDYYRIGEWKDEIDVLRLHSEWHGYLDIAAHCRNALRAN